MPLPDVLKFLAPGWWMVHAIAIFSAYQWGFNSGRASERRAQRVRDVEKGK